MTTHELARLLLEKKDLPVLVDGEGEVPIGVIDDAYSTETEANVPCVIIETSNELWRRQLMSSLWLDSRRVS